MMSSSKLKPGEYIRATSERAKPPGSGVFIRTGEYRAPRKGEWYLSGALPEAYRAPNDLSSPYYILRERPPA